MSLTRKEAREKVVAKIEEAFKKYFTARNNPENREKITVQKEIIKRRKGYKKAKNKEENEEKYSQMKINHEKEEEKK